MEFTSQRPLSFVDEKIQNKMKKTELDLGRTVLTGLRKIQNKKTCHSITFYSNFVFYSCFYVHPLSRDFFRYILLSFCCCLILQHKLRIIWYNNFCSVVRCQKFSIKFLAIDEQVATSAERNYKKASACIGCLFAQGLLISCVYKLCSGFLFFKIFSRKSIFKCQEVRV